MAQPLNFPARIYQILENESPDIIVWNSNGLSFRIVNHIRFEAEVIPKYFRHRKLSSVQRQLNVYGFRSISRGEHKRSFYHPLFKRGNWEVVKQMARYVPTKAGQHMDIDPSSIESVFPEEETTTAYEKAALHGASRSVVGSAGQAPAQRMSFFPIVRGSQSGTVQICMDDDFLPDHFASDFQSTSDVGHEHNHIRIEPVDYSIPIDFSARQYGGAHNAAVPASAEPAFPHSGSGDDVRMCSDGSSAGECDWAMTDDTMMWADLVFDAELEGAESWTTAPTRIRRTSSARLFSQLTPPLEGSAEDDDGRCGAPEPKLRMQSGSEREFYNEGCCGGEGYSYAPVSDGEGTSTTAWAAAAARYRSDSMNDVFALCAELI